MWGFSISNNREYTLIIKHLRKINPAKNLRNSLKMSTFVVDDKG